MQAKHQCTEEINQSLKNKRILTCSAQWSCMLGSQFLFLPSSYSPYPCWVLQFYLTLGSSLSSPLFSGLLWSYSRQFSTEVQRCIDGISNSFDLPPSHSGSNPSSVPPSPSARATLPRYPLHPLPQQPFPGTPSASFAPASLAELVDGEVGEGR